MQNLFSGIYKDKVVLITGHTGFKGFWLSAFLNYFGAEIYGISIDVPSVPSIYETAKSNLLFLSSNNSGNNLCH